MSDEKLEEIWCILYHGTKRENVRVILKKGFKSHTFFAKNMADALKFGGPYIFEVVFERSKYPEWFSGELCWQLVSKEVIPQDRIVCLTKLTGEILMENKKLRDEVFRRSLPYYKRGHI